MTALPENIKVIEYIKFLLTFPPKLYVWNILTKTMSGVNAISIFIRASLITLTVLFHYSIAQQTSVTPTPFKVLPLWNLAINNDTQPCRLEQRNSSQDILLHGSAHQICSVQINMIHEYDARIAIPKTSVLQEESFLLYVERQGDLAECKNRYVAFAMNADVCNVVFLQDSFQINLRGNVSIYHSAW